MTTTPPFSLSRRGFCLILSSPSGAGKSSLARRLLEIDKNLVLSVSVTTRLPRPQERDGIDYFFVSKQEFFRLQESGGLLEWAEVFGNLYGTPADAVTQALAEGRDVIFDIDWQGAEAIALILPEDSVRVFILPPSREELTRRIYGRASDPRQVIETRLKAANDEMSHWQDYDYIVVNAQFDDSVSALKAIVEAERLKRCRQSNIGDFVGSLLLAGERD